jgi:hypothetical protein
VNYLVSDHLDVYIATSMRERHEYVAVSRFTKRLFGSKVLRNLNVRWFDPTQAYCENRIDKGLAEALMLKRAKCTIYLAQESDTLGKDSELASTLAQGKTVIAYVPQFEEKDIDRHIDDVLTSSPRETAERFLSVRSWFVASSPRLSNLTSKRCQKRVAVSASYGKKFRSASTV